MPERENCALFHMDADLQLISRGDRCLLTTRPKERLCTDKGTARHGQF